MQLLWVLWRRELMAYLRTPLGYVVICACLLLDGLLFNAFALSGEKRSTEVLELFFYTSSGPLMVACIFLAMRLFAEERQNNTLVLLGTSPLSDAQLVWGKFLAAWVFCLLINALTLYMPMLIFVHGKIAIGHILTGYIGLSLLAAAALGLSMVSSVLCRTQLAAAVGAGALVTTFVVFWLLARIANPPVDSIIAYMSLHDKHFRPFMQGLLSLSDIIFYLSLTWVCLVLAEQILATRRWR